LAEALLRYLRQMKREERALWRRLFFPHEWEPVPGTERVVHSVAIVVDAVVKGVYVELRTGWGTRSRAATMEYFDNPGGVLPSDVGDGSGPLVTRPLKGSASTFLCNECKGSGRVECDACGGRGKQPCPACSGLGFTLGQPDGCTVCSGWGVAKCAACSGTRTVRHESCEGEGRRAKWTEIAYAPSSQEHRKVVLPKGRSEGDLPEAVIDWLPLAGKPIGELSPEAISKALGYSSGVSEVIASANAVVAKLAERAREDGYRAVSVAPRYGVVPLSSYSFRTTLGRVVTRWVVGRGLLGVDVDPGSATGGAGVVKPGDAAERKRTNQFLVLWQLWMVGAAALREFWLMFAPLLPLAAWRFGWRGIVERSVALNLARPRVPRVRTVAVVASGDEGRTYLACLALIGSLVDKLRVTDVLVRPHLEALVPGPVSSITNFAAGRIVHA
jgi:hypothetical protein